MAKYSELLAAVGGHFAPDDWLWLQKQPTYNAALGELKSWKEIVGLFELGDELLRKAKLPTRPQGVSDGRLRRPSDRSILALRHTSSSSVGEREQQDKGAASSLMSGRLMFAPTPEFLSRELRSVVDRRPLALQSN